MNKILSVFIVFIEIVSEFIDSIFLDSHWEIPKYKYKIRTNPKLVLKYIKNPKKSCPWNFNETDRTIAEIYNSLKK
jgi:hypothetical protein